MRAFLFEWTSTSGVRATPVRRSELERRFEQIGLCTEVVRVKIGLLGERIVSAKPEHDDVLRAARRLGRPPRQVYDDVVAATHGICDDPNGVSGE